MSPTPKEGRHAFSNQRPRRRAPSRLKPDPLVDEVDLTGQPVDGGGVVLDTSQVTLGPPQQPGLYHGTVVALEGGRITIDLQSAGRPNLELTMTVQTDPSGTKLTRSLRAQTTTNQGNTSGGGQ